MVRGMNIPFNYHEETIHMYTFHDRTIEEIGYNSKDNLILDFKDQSESSVTNSYFNTSTYDFRTTSFYEDDEHEEIDIDSYNFQRPIEFNMSPTNSFSINNILLRSSQISDSTHDPVIEYWYSVYEFANLDYYLKSLISHAAAPYASAINFKKCKIYDKCLIFELYIPCPMGVTDKTPYYTFVIIFE